MSAHQCLFGIQVAGLLTCRKVCVKEVPTFKSIYNHAFLTSKVFSMVVVLFQFSVSDAIGQCRHDWMRGALDQCVAYLASEFYSPNLTLASDTSLFLERWYSAQRSHLEVMLYIRRFSIEFIEDCQLLAQNSLLMVDS